MIWLNALQFLLNAFLAFVAFHITVYPVDKEREKLKILVLYIMIVVCILGSGALSIYQYKDAEKKETENGKRFATFQTNILQNTEIEKKELSTKIDIVTTNLVVINALRQRYENLVTYIVTNQSFNPEARQNIIEADKTNIEVLNSELEDLNTWEAGLRAKLRDERASFQIQHENQSREWQTNYLKAIPNFDYTIRKLLALAEKVAALRGDKVVSNYHGMPSILNPDDPNIVDIVEIRLQTTANWDTLPLALRAMVNWVSCIFPTCSSIFRPVTTGS